MISWIARWSLARDGRAAGLGEAVAERTKAGIVNERRGLEGKVVKSIQLSDRLGGRASLSTKDKQPIRFRLGRQVPGTWVK